MRWVRMTVGLALGFVTALVELPYALICGYGLLISAPSSRARAATLNISSRGAIHLARIEHRRITRFLGGNVPAVTPGPRTLAYIAIRPAIGILGGLVLGLLLFGLAAAASMLLAWSTGFPWAAIEDGGRVTWETLATVTIPGIVLLFLNITGIAGVAELDRRLADRMLGPDPTARYERRISELTISRAEVVDAVNDERRRIERALHDGVQQRLVALGMLLGRARRSRTEEQERELLAQAHDEARRALDDLKEVAWRIYPAALDDGGLAAALETVAERTAIPTTIRYGPTDHLSKAVETVTYFVVCEAVTNAAKHSQANKVEVTVEQHGARLRATITDDGIGGADPTGGGLAGLAGRVAALDGSFAVDSPKGGPTVIIVDLPCV